MSFVACYVSALGVIDIYGQLIEPSDIALVGLLVLLEGILSIDNALVLGLLAKRLPKSQQARALSYGLIGAFVFRFLAIGMATILLRSTIAKFLGGAYLVYISLKHLIFSSKEHSSDVVVLDDEGSPQLVDEETHLPLSREREELELKERMPFELEAIEDVTGTAPEKMPKQDDWRFFWWTVLVIEMTDIAFAVDSIVAAIGVVGAPPKGTPKEAFHPKLWVVVVGGFLGVIVMRFAAAIFIKLLDRFPRFETSAYLLVFLIGGKLLADWGFNSDWTSWGSQWNYDLAISYHQWLEANWPLNIPPPGEHPHLLDFHDLRRPECILFWAGMLVAFCVGFIGARPEHETQKSPPPQKPSA
jgi:YkoY family integral membrane protein